MSQDRLHALGAAEHLERVAVEVARLAALLVAASTGQAAPSHTKSSPTDVVTLTDVQSEQLIRDELLSRCPGSAIVGEELDDAPGENGIGWIVDPIDGTVNFLYDLPVVAVSIAATVGGRVVAGAVADVHRGEVFSAAENTGARLDGRPIEASRSSRLDQSLIGTGFSYSAALRSEQAAVLQELLPAVRDIRCMGSAALNLCWVANGRLEAYFERDLKVYDHAAGALIASEAGADVRAAPDQRTDLTYAASSGISGQLMPFVGLTAAD